MKCQNCGRDEVNFHYSSSINGCVTETHLCGECAARAGYDPGRFFSAGDIFGAFFPMFGVRTGFPPSGMRSGLQNMAYPIALQPAIGGYTQDQACCSACGKAETTEGSADVDEKMLKRRELNLKMRAAIESEDFEKAAELRDRIREMEA